MNTWCDVRPGDRIKVRGDVYDVRGVSYPETVWGGKPAGVFQLIAPDGSGVCGRMNLDIPVEILRDVTLEEASAVARIVLGAVEVGERSPDSEKWVCPEWMDGPTHAYHMKFFHYGETEHSDETAHIPHTHG